MAQRDNILQELNELQSSLAHISSQNIYQLPAGYFDNLADQVLNRLKALEAETPAAELNYLSPLVSSISKEMPFSVPRGFFEDLDERTIQTIKIDTENLSPAEELEILSPVLRNLKKEMPYQVPEGYFEKMATIPAAKPQAKLVSIKRQKWMRYAAAAILTGFLVTAGFLLFNNEKIDPNTQSSEWVNKNMRKISTDEINEFVQLANEEAPAIASSDARNEIKDRNEIQELIKDIPDKDIQDFLDETQTEETDNNENLLLN